MRKSITIIKNKRRETIWMGESIDKAIEDHVSFADADLAWEHFVGRNLYKHNFEGANLEHADFGGASCMRANFKNSNLSMANLCGSQLIGAHLTGAIVENTDFPSAPMVLSADWEDVSDELLLELARYNAANCPNLKDFEEWANGHGPNPFLCKRVQEATFFNYLEYGWQMDRMQRIWSPGPAMRPYALMVMVLEEKCQGFKPD